MPARYEIQREYEMGLAEEMLALHYTRQCDPSFRRFAVAVFGADNRDMGDDLPVLLWDATESGRLCSEPAARAALGRLVARLREVESPLLEFLHLSQAQDRLLGLVRLAELYESWVRDPESWAGEEDIEDPFGPLARHLLARYPVPQCMDALLFGRGYDLRPQWFAHVGGGQNLRTAPGFPVPLTKKMAHHVLEAPEGLSFTRAIRRGQVLGFDGSEELAAALGVTWLGRDLLSAEEEAWWSTVIQWLANQVELEIPQVGPILDYIRHCKRRYPDYEMKGRGLRPLLVGMERWHRALRRPRERKKPEERKQPAPFLPAGFRSGKWSFGNRQWQMVWMMQEVLTLRALREEGYEQQHCVYSYDGAIRSGRTSIWSLQLRRGDGFTARVLTVEVHNATRTIVQARGKHNRMPNQDEQLMLEYWARENALRIELE